MEKVTKKGEIIVGISLITITIIFSALIKYNIIKDTLIKYDVLKDSLFRDYQLDYIIDNLYYIIVLPVYIITTFKARKQDRKLYLLFFFLILSLVLNLLLYIYWI